MARAAFVLALQISFLMRSSEGWVEKAVVPIVPPPPLVAEVRSLNRAPLMQPYNGPSVRNAPSLTFVEYAEAKKGYKRAIPKPPKDFGIDKIQIAVPGKGFEKQKKSKKAVKLPSDEKTQARAAAVDRLFTPAWKAGKAPAKAPEAAPAAAPEAVPEAASAAVTAAERHLPAVGIASFLLAGGGVGVAVAFITVHFRHAHSHSESQAQAPLLAA